MTNQGVTEGYATRLSSLVLPQVDGDPVRLGELWRERPAVVVFLRHYG